MSFFVLDHLHPQDTLIVHPISFDTPSPIAVSYTHLRAHETLSRLPVFKTGAFNRAATHPKDCWIIGYFGCDRRSMTKLL